MRFSLPTLISFSFLIIFLSACNGQSSKTEFNRETDSIKAYEIINEHGSTIEERFRPVKGFQRNILDSNSFAFYLRSLALKPFDSKVMYHHGGYKNKHNVYISVVDMDIDDKDLQQCADAVMRLKAEYHYARKEYDAIHFNFLSDGKPRYYKDYAKGDYSYSKFRKYMNYIFSYANTASLHNEMKSVSIFNMQIGDVFIQKTSTIGHAIIVVDMIENEEGEKMFMLAQSYMPAQETQILVNPNNDSTNPWYKLEAGIINTPEWRFGAKDLRRFKN